MLDEVIGFNVRSVLVIGIGGGGDVVGSTITYSLAVNEGKGAILGAVLWERYVNDVVPGPIRIQELRNADALVIIWPSLMVTPTQLGRVGMSSPPK